MSPRRSARDAILDAAEAVVRENGAAHLTLDAVSLRAGVSKGGLLYHFRTKEALLLGMLERLGAAFKEARRAEAAKLPEGRTRELKAQILSAGFFQSHRVRGIGSALLAAGAHDPRLLKPARETRNAMLQEIHAAGLAPAFTKIVLLSLEGLWILEMLGMYTPGAAERQDLIRELLRLVDDADARAGAAPPPASPAKNRSRRAAAAETAPTAKTAKRAGSGKVRT